jgi:thioredoxin 1
MEVNMSGIFTKPVTDAEFEKEVLQSETPVLVDFWAEWCGPCRALGPKLEEVAEKMSAKVKVLKINVDENPQTPQRYGVRGIPTMILFKGGSEVEQIVGNQPKENIEALLHKHTS